MALVADVFILAPDVRMSILTMGTPMRPYTLTQTDQSSSNFPSQTGRTIRFPRDAVTHEEPMQRANPDRSATLDQPRLDFD